ncbi:hypothetical protein Ancab_009857 [Ancistrocladus abbreviatus]
MLARAEVINPSRKYSGDRNRLKQKEEAVRLCRGQPTIHQHSQTWSGIQKARRRLFSSYSSTTRKVYLSAALQCKFPDANLSGTISTGLFDYVWVQFYNNYCEYANGSAHQLLSCWTQWITVDANQVFLGIPTATGAAGGGYISSDVLIAQVLPTVKESSKYGGVMLWNRHFDRGHSTAIKSDV